MQAISNSEETQLHRTQAEAAAGVILKEGKAGWVVIRSKKHLDRSDHANFLEKGKLTMKISELPPLAVHERVATLGFECQNIKNHYCRKNSGKVA